MTRSRSLLVLLACCPPLWLSCGVDIPTTRSRVGHYGGSGDGGFGDGNSGDGGSATRASLTINAIVPPSAVAGTGDLTISITGSGFDGAGFIRSETVWTANGKSALLATTVLSETQLTAVIPASFLASPASATVMVEQLEHMEGGVEAWSNRVNFSVTAALPLP